MERDIRELVDILETYDRLRREAFAYIKAMNLISQLVPKSEFIMPLGTRSKEILTEITDLLKRVERVTGKPDTPELLYLRERFFVEYQRSLKSIDDMVKAAEV